MLPELKTLLQHKALFVTGTDTGVGKTITTVTLASLMGRTGAQVCAVKCVASGGEVNPLGQFVCEDSIALGGAMTDAGADLLEEIAGVSRISPLYGFTDPIAPWTAAERDGKRIDGNALRKTLDNLLSEAEKRSIQLLVEGVGGVMVPFGPDDSVASLATDLSIPVVLVGRTALGTINHTLLSLEALQRRGVEVAAVILSRQEGGEQSLAEIASLRELQHWIPAGIPIFLQEFSQNGEIPVLLSIRSV